MKKTIYGSLLLFIFATTILLSYAIYQKLDAQSTVSTQNDQVGNGGGNIKTSNNVIMYPTFTDNFNLNDNYKWHNVIGNWSYIPYGLQGGIDGKVNSQQNNILVGPIATNSSVISTTFRVNNLDDNVSNYASIVNSFSNRSNYQQAGINIYKGNVYVLFSKIVNGVLINDPPWPGIKTELKWNPGTSYVMSLVTKGNSQDLIINGTKYLAHNNNNNVNNNGYAGLDYGRVKDIVFYNFAIINNNVASTK